MMKNIQEQPNMNDNNISKHEALNKTQSNIADNDKSELSEEIMISINTEVSSVKYFNERKSNKLLLKFAIKSITRTTSDPRNQMLERQALKAQDTLWFIQKVSPI